MSALAVHLKGAPDQGTGTSASSRYAKPHHGAWGKAVSDQEECDHRDHSVTTIVSNPRKAGNPPTACGPNDVRKMFQHLLESNAHEQPLVIKGINSLEVSKSSINNLFSIWVGIELEMESSLTEKLILMIRHLLTSLCASDGHSSHPDAHVWPPAVHFEVQRMNSQRDSVEHVIMDPTPACLGGLVSMLNALNTTLFEAVSPSLPDIVPANLLYAWQRLVNVCLYNVQDRSKAQSKGKSKARESLTIYGIASANNQTVRAVLGDISDDRYSKDLCHFPFLGSKKTAFCIFPLPKGKESMTTNVGDSTSQRGQKKQTA